MNFTFPPRYPRIKITVDWRRWSPAWIALDWHRKGYAYEAGKPRLMLGVYYGTKAGGLKAKWHRWFLKTERA